MLSKTELKDPLKYIPRFFVVQAKPERGSAEGKLVPMKLYRAQEYWIKNRTPRDIILKPRQIRISTAVMAANAHLLFTSPFQRQTIIANDDETATFLLTTIERFWRNLPDELRPATDWKSGCRMRFPGIDAYVYIDSAKSDTIGIGHGLTTAHLSEFSRWPAKKANQLFADITQTIPSGAGYVTIESTPQGRNKFWELYNAAKKNEINYKPFFFPWWWVEDYWAPVVGKFEATKEERLLMDTYQLRPEQIMFRREKIAEIKGLFFQEYPENDVDCWLSSDISIIDGDSLRRYYPLIRPGTEEGNLTIWKDVIGGHKYMIGVDVASGVAKGDYSVAAVLDVRMNEYVARLRGRIAPDLFMEQVYKLGMRYSEAEIGVERMGHGHTVIRGLMEQNYPKLYHHTDYDVMTKQESAQPGWKTSTKTKPMMVDGLVTAIRSQDLLLYSENLLYEASNLSWNGQKVEKGPGGFDDEWDAVSIALQLREISPVIEPERGRITSYARI